MAIYVNFFLVGLLLPLISFSQNQLGCAGLPQSITICYDSTKQLNVSDNVFTKPDYSGVFNGKSCIMGPESDKVNFKSGNLSIGTWIYPTSVYGKKVILSKLYSPLASYGSYYLSMQDGIVRFTARIHGGNSKSVITVQSPVPIKTNEWCHIGVQCSADSGFIRLYINGVKRGQMPFGGRFFSEGKNKLVVGAQHRPVTDSYIDGFIGEIDHIRIWRKVIPVKSMVSSVIFKDSLLLAYEFSGLDSRSMSDNAQGFNNGQGLNITFSENISPFYKRKTPKYIWNTGDSTPTLTVQNRKSALYKVLIKAPTGFCKDSIQVIVNPEETSILGRSVCKQKTTEIYSVPAANGMKYKWIVTGGEIIAGNSTNNITVTWGKRGKGNISLQEISTTGCRGPLNGFQVDIKKKL